MGAVDGIIEERTDGHLVKETVRQLPNSNTVSVAVLAQKFFLPFLKIITCNV